MTVWILYDEVSNASCNDFILKVFSTKEKAYEYMIAHFKYEDYPDMPKEELINDILADNFEGIAIFEEEVM